jgi:hypothetical protein
MPRVSFKYGLTEDDKAIAKQNGLSMSTVYARLRSGWDKETAINQKPGSNPFANLDRDPNGELVSRDPKGKTRSFQLPARLDADLDAAIASSGISTSDWIAQAAIAKLEQKSKISKK